MNISSLLDALVSSLRESDALDGVKIIAAYPHSVRPSMLKESVIAVGFADITLDTCHIGSTQKAGEVRLFADIFVPYGEEAKKACDIFVAMCLALGNMNITAISAERICTDNHTQSYVMKTVLTLTGRAELGGEGGE